MSARTGFQGHSGGATAIAKTSLTRPGLGARRSRDREANGRGGGFSVGESATTVMTCLHTTLERESTEWDRPIVARIEGKGKGKGKRVVRKANKTVYIYRSRLPTLPTLSRSEAPSGINPPPTNNGTKNPLPTTRPHHPHTPPAIPAPDICRATSSYEKSIS